jgi:hypothetical protein
MARSWVARRFFRRRGRHALAAVTRRRSALDLTAPWKNLWLSHSGGVLARVVILGLTFSLAFAFGYLRQIAAPTALAADPVAPAAGDPRIALWAAADDLTAKLGPGGSGVTFSATQIQIMRPYLAGPALIVGPDRNHPDAIPTSVDQLVLGAVSGRGSATDGSFFAEWFNGTGDNGSPTFQGDVAYAALARDGGLWRRDATTNATGAGWLPASDIPGFGVDPLSLRELPELLRRLDGATDLGTDTTGHHWSGHIDPIWYPGAVAVDGAAFTGAPITIELWLDAQNRLVSLFAAAQNINEPVYQLLCFDRVGLDYTTPVSIPDAPTPAATIEVTP